MQSIETIIIHPTSDGNHFASHVCQGICTECDGTYSIQFLKTKKWFDERRFRLSPGDQLTAPETNRNFTVTDVMFAAKRPKYVIVTARLSGSVPIIGESEMTGGLAS